MSNPIVKSCIHPFQSLRGSAKMSNLMSFQNVVYKPFIHPTQTKTIVKSFIHPFPGIFNLQHVVLSSKLISRPELHFAPSICYHSNKSCQRPSCSFSKYVSAGHDPNPSKPNKRKADVFGKDNEDQQPPDKKAKKNIFREEFGRESDSDSEDDVEIDHKQPDVIPPDQDNLPFTRTTVQEFQEKHEAWLLNHLKEVTEMDPTLKVGAEVAALVNVLKLFNFSDDNEKHSLVGTASKGAEKMQEGLVQVKKGQDLLRKAIVQMLQLPPPAARP